MKLLLAKISFLSIILIAISSCSKDSCKDVSCPVTLECSHGACVCPNGYQGTNCDTLSAPKYLGTYQVSEEGCQNFPPNTVSVTWGGTADSLPGLLLISYLFSQSPATQIYIINIPGSLGVNFTVPQQYVGTGTEEVLLTGTGSALLNSANSVNSITLDLNYTIVATGQNYTCSELMNKF
jgi:hypothetical protein